MVEKYRKHIYCQKEFLEDCVSRLNDTNSREAQSALLFWKEIRSFILNPNIKLYLNYTSEEFGSIVSEIEKQRLKASRKGRNLELSPMESIILDINNNQLVGSLHIHFSQININDSDWICNSLEKQNAVFLINEDVDFAQQIQLKYGVLAIGKQEHRKLKEQLCDRSLAIHRKESTNWSKILSGIKITGNSMILVDNYVLNDTKSINENIKNLFNVLLPQQLSEGMVFQILVVTTLRQNKFADLDCKSRYSQVTGILSEIRPNLCYELAILKNDGNMFHDRTIITNYAYISCGAGFDLFKDGVSQKTTTIMDFPSFLNPYSEWLSDAYSNLLADLCEIYYNAPEFTQNCMPQFIMGKKENRILGEYSKLL